MIIRRAIILILSGAALVLGTGWAANFVIPLAVLQQVGLVSEANLRGVDWQIGCPLGGEAVETAVYLIIQEKHVIFHLSKFHRDRQEEKWVRSWDALEPIIVWKSSAGDFRQPPSDDWPYRSWRYYTIGLPLGGMFILAAVYPCVAFVRGPLRRRWRSKRGLCLKCGYSLRGLPEPRCPECGMLTDHERLAARGVPIAGF